MDSTNIYGYNSHYQVNNNSNNLYQAAHMSSGGHGVAPAMSMTAAGYMSNPPQQGHHSHSVRRRISPDDLLSMEAPTQSRRYITPSSTSKKEYPRFVAGSMRPPSQPSDEEDDELTEEPPAANATDQEKIEWKRRQNTLAARRSRKRKMVYQQQLEVTVDRLTMEKEVWKTRALTLKQLLHSHGIPCPDFKD